MLDNETITNVLGTIGTILWCIQLVPQIWHNYRKKDTDGLPAAMMLIWAASSIPFGAYAIIQDFALPLELQPQIFAVLAVITYGQILYYDHGVAVFNAVVAVVGLWIAIGAAEAALIFGSKLLYQHQTTWHTTVLAIFAAVLFISGFFPAFLEIWYRRGRVAGISFGFLFIDCAGALFSLAALGFHEHFDVQGGLLYLMVVVIEVCIASSHLLWLWRTRHLHRRAKELGVSFDQLPEAAPYQKQGDKLPVLNESTAIAAGHHVSNYGTVGTE